MKSLFRPWWEFRKWLLTAIHVALFCANLLLLHLPLLIARLFGVAAMDQVLHLHCLFHLINIRLTGASFTVRMPFQVKERRPRILISNHQSMYDIPLIIWYLRKVNPKFVAKRELKYWIPSISFALRAGKHLIIDRARGREALQIIREYGRASFMDHRCVCIFPEGTRSRDGELRDFKSGGFVALLEAMPDAEVLPITIDGMGKVVANGLFPVGTDAKVLFEVHPPLTTEGRPAEEVLEEAESIIRKSLYAWRETP